MTKLWSIARNTFIQTVRQPIYGVLIFVAFIALVLTVPLAGWTMGMDYIETDQKMLKNVGLATLLWSGLTVAVFSAWSALSREIQDRTALTVVSKPVARSLFVLGKFLGVAAAVALAYYLCSVVFLMTVHHGVISAASMPIHWPVIVFGCTALLLGILAAAFGNFAFGWSFISSAVVSLAVLLTAALAGMSFFAPDWSLAHQGLFDAPGSGQLLMGMYLMFLCVMLLTAVALAASARLGPILTLLAALGVWFLGSQVPALRDLLSERLARGEDAFGTRALLALLPDLTLFYPLDALARGWQIPAGFIGMATLYFLAYTAAVLLLAIALFQTRPVAASGTNSSLPGAVALLSGTGRLTAVAAAILAAVLLTQTSTYQLTGLLTVGGLIVAAAGGYWLWKAFGSGKKWAWWIVVVLAAGLAGSGAVILTLAARREDTALLAGYRAAVLLTTALAAAVLIATLLPKSRHHFSTTTAGG
jgi:ABC-type transport system involved in multi-copper enzyme maturation permease subunit